MEWDNPDDLNSDSNIKCIPVGDIMYQVNSKHDIFHLITQY